MTDRVDIHQHITNQIIAAIEAGPGDFRLPWHRPGGCIGRPANAVTGRRYQGVNVLALWAAAELRGYSSGRWATFRQWQEAGAQVRKGEKSSLVVFFKSFDVTETDDQGQSHEETRLVARATPVFAAEQVDGWQPEPLPAPVHFDPLTAAEAFVAATGATIVHGGSIACYRLSTDTVHMPERTAFLGTPTSSPAESYYSTLFHELTHWTGPASRCDRQFGKRFGDQAYAAEELVAELGAAFLCADLGITATPRVDHSQYLAHWLTLMKADKKALFTAASQANRAVTWLQEPRG